ncbi:ABC transporter permease [Microtetraspora sp. NBRC 16547]|uniref:ABC transporter permease n=1 Tax=Microtetraspora sp. NBRC 16547 TaxID=3030993 RepID=UPI0024A517B4|nr:ABC transporter permease [Microtetraspora sp. NBRC 16547]GLX00363.1 transport permease protein [Microtetraspora sp. NBRC 16547]
MTTVRETLAAARLGGRIYWRDKQALTATVLTSVGLGIGLPVLMDRLRSGDPSLVVAQLIGMLAVVLTLSAFNQSAISLTFRRDQLILKRLRAAGLSDGAVLGGELLNIMTQSVLIALVTTVAVVNLTSATAPRDPLLFTVFVVLGATVLTLLGAAWTVVIPRAEVSAPMSVPFFMIAGLGAGAFGPMGQLLPGWLTTALDLLPTAAVVRVGRATFADGTFVDDLQAAAVPLLILSVWAAIALLVISRRFRWEPRRS